MRNRPVDFIAGEIWLPVLDCPDRYAVSNLGRVKGLAIRIQFLSKSGRPFSRTLLERLLSVRENSGKYQAISLHLDGEVIRRYVAHLVAETFIGPNVSNLDVCHNDGNKSNNRKENLRYDTRVGNLEDTKLHGTRLYGIKNHQTKLSADDTFRIILRTDTVHTLGSLFGVSDRHIRSVRSESAYIDRCVRELGFNPKHIHTYIANLRA